MLTYRGISYHMHWSYLLHVLIGSTSWMLTFSPPLFMTEPQHVRHHVRRLSDPEAVSPTYLAQEHLLTIRSSSTMGKDFSMAPWLSRCSKFSFSWCSHV
jgi:hypothetical protein